MRNELIFHTPCSAKQSYFSKYLCNCWRGKARLELTPSVLCAQLGLMRCLPLIGASYSSGSTLLWLFISLVLSLSKCWQRPWAISSSSTARAVLEQLPCTGNLLLIPRDPSMSKCFIKVQTQKNGNSTSVSGVWSAIKRFLLSWIFGLHPGPASPYSSPF